MKDDCEHKWYDMGEVETESTGKKTYHQLYMCTKCTGTKTVPLEKEEVKEDDWRRNI